MSKKSVFSRKKSVFSRKKSVFSRKKSVFSRKITGKGIKWAQFRNFSEKHKNSTLKKQNCQTLLITRLHYIKPLTLNKLRL